MRRYSQHEDFAGTMLETPGGEWVRKKDHDRDVESWKNALSAVSHDYYAEMDRADRLAVIADALAAELEGYAELVNRLVAAPTKAEAENERLREECSARRMDCKKLRAELAACRPYRDAVRSMHNGYDPECRSVMPSLKEPESPKAAIQDLIKEAEELAESEIEQYQAELAAAKEREARLLVACPDCKSRNVSRFQWVDGYGFEYWTCWDCDRLFNVNPTAEQALNH